MKKSKKIIALLLAMLMLVSCVMGTLVSCGDDDDNDGSNSGENSNGSNGTGDSANSTTVRVKTLGGRVLKDITVYIYTDSSLEDIVNFAKTDANGIATIKTEYSDGYVVVLDGVADGYHVQEYYELKGNSLDIVLNSSVILPETDGAYTVPPKYSLGDIMYDFEVKTIDSVNPKNVKTLRLSDLLKTKKAVLINFWFTTCSPCASEFPYMDKVALEYSDDIAVVCLNTYGESESEIATYKAANELSLDVARADNALFAAFGTNAYPTNVIVDRYGTICMIEKGGLTSEKPFRKMFEYFSAPDAEYEQKLFASLDELIPREIPDIQQEDSSVLEGVLNNASINNKDGSSKITYYPETGTADAEYSWPFIVAKKGDFDCIKPSNTDKDSSYAMMHADVAMKRGDVLGFDYFSSTEENADVLHVLVDGEAIYQISGEGKKWNKCYPYVAKADGTYTVSFVYVKDTDTYKGDDSVYLRDFRIVEKDDIDVETYIPYQAATRNDATGEFSYVDVKYCSQDGYYHVCSETDSGHICAGKCPIVLANLMGVNSLGGEESVYLWAYNGEIVLNNVNYADRIIQYCSYSSNGTISGFCSVNRELKELLDKVVQIKGFAEDKTNEWLRFCKYYDAYATEDGKALADPIAGLAPHSAFDTYLSFDSEEALNNSDYDYKVLTSENEYPNNVYYDGRIIIPRGFWYAFTPTESGVYRVTSNSEDSLNSWIFNYDEATFTTTQVYEYDHTERITKIPADPDDPKHQMNNVSMVMFMEAGKTYYIDIAYYDTTMVGEFTFKVEYVAESLAVFRAASPGGAFTSDVDENGNIGDTIIAGGINVALDESTGYYRHVLGKDKNGKNIFGGYVYLDLTFAAGPFDKPIYSDPSLIKDGAMRKDLVSLGAFNFKMTANDRNGLLYLKLNAILGLKEYAKSGSDKTFRKELAGNIEKWELEAIKKYVEVSADDEIFNFIITNYSESVEDAELAALIKAYDDAAKAKEDTEAKEAAIVSYAKTISDEKLKLLIAVKDDDKVTSDYASRTYVNDYTDALLTSTYLSPLNISDSVKTYLDKYVTNALKDMWGDDYEFWSDDYNIEELKDGILHGKGKDYTGDILSYVDKMFSSETDLTDSSIPAEVRAELTEEAYGCVLVDEALAKILQKLMDQNTFEDVVNSWTKMCYYYEMHDSNTKY